jgi:hypothetical protein
MESASSPEEPGKKRYSVQVECGTEEKSKKVRVVHGNSGRKKTSSAQRETRNSQDGESGGNTKTMTGRAFRTTLKSSDINEASEGLPKIWDMESALLYLTQGDTDEKELLSNKRNAPWVTFRVGHAGDASAIVNWYRQSTLMDNPEPELEVIAPPETNSDNDSHDETSRSSMLEVWLANGLGDEDNPPAVHALVAQVHEEQDVDKVSTLMAGVVLFTHSWEHGERVLRIPWIHFDSRVPFNARRMLEQRTWLRISILSQMTACQSIAVHEDLMGTTVANDETKESPSPCAE